MSKAPILTQFYNSPIGELILGSHEGNLVLCDWRYRKMRDQIDLRIQNALTSKFKVENAAIIEQTIEQLQEYFQKKRNHFTIPTLLIGTVFQKNVWKQLQNIPYGKTESYLGLSKKLNNEKAIRAVASANGANAIAILIPCHRVIGSKGELTGYAGGLTAKRKLLALENDNFNPQLNLF